MISEKTAVIVIDLQREYFEEHRPWYVPDSERVFDNCQRILNAARDSEATVLHARHVQPSEESPVFGWGSEYTEIINDIDIQENEYLITKTKPSCFQDTRLNDILARNGIENVVSTGLLSAICVDTTAREVHARGYNSYYIKDATSMFPVNGADPDEITDTIATVHDTIFSEVTSTEEITSRLY